MESSSPNIAPDFVHPKSKRPLAQENPLTLEEATSLGSAVAAATAKVRRAATLGIHVTQLYLESSAAVFALYC